MKIDHIFEGNQYAIFEGIISTFEEVLEDKFTKQGNSYIYKEELVINFTHYEKHDISEYKNKPKILNISCNLGGYYYYGNIKRSFGIVLGLFGRSKGDINTNLTFLTQSLFLSVIYLDESKYSKFIIGDFGRGLRLLEHGNLSDEKCKQKDDCELYFERDSWDSLTGFDEYFLFRTVDNLLDITDIDEEKKILYNLKNSI